MAPRSSTKTKSATTLPSADLIRTESRGDDLHMFGRAVYLPRGWHGPRRQNVFFLITMLKGSVMIDLNGRRIELGPGQGAILPPRGLEFFRFDQSVRSIHNWCQIAPTIANREECALMRASCHSSPTPPGVNALIEEGLSAPMNASPSLNRAMQVLAKACLLRFAAKSPENTETNTPRHPGVQRAVEAVTMNPSRFRTAEELALHCGISYSRLRKLFQDDQGESPSAMIWRLKTDHAVQLIRATGLSLAEVAEQCGFSNAFHLSRCVRERKGLSPRELRKSLRESAR